MKRRTRWSAVAGAAAAALALSLAPTTAAAAERIDVLDFTVRDVVFSGPGCEYVNAYVKRSIDATVEDYVLDVDVTRYGRLSDWLDYSPENYFDRAVVCDWEGVGSYGLGASHVAAYDSGGRWHEYEDATRVGFNARAQALMSFTAHRDGNYVTLSAAARYYSPAYSVYRAYSPRDVKFQKRTSAGWRTIQMKDFSNGRGSVRIYAPGLDKYRIVANQTAIQTTAWSRMVWQ